MSAKRSSLELILAMHMRALLQIDFVEEYKFHETRKWRFDFAFPEIKLAVEVEGGTFVNGRHNRGIGFEQDCIKYDEAMRDGWTVYRCTGAMIKSGQAIQTIEILIEQLETRERK